MASPAVTREDLLELKLAFRRDKRDSPRGAGVLMSLKQWTALIDVLRLGKLIGLERLAGKLEMMFDAAVRAHRKPLVFILYCNDPLPGKSSPKCCDAVLILADLLNRSGGLICECDHYHMHKANWSIWVEEMIEKSDAVLLVCSPMMDEHLKHPSNQLMEMTRGRVYADCIPNYIDPTKVIPVFLNSERQLHLVPKKLHTVTHYELRVGELMSRMGSTSGMTAELFAERLRELLGEPVFRDIALLLASLRGEPYTSRPLQPRQPIKLPPLPQSATIQLGQHSTSRPKKKTRFAAYYSRLRRRVGFCNSTKKSPKKESSSNRELSDPQESEEKDISDSVASHGQQGSGSPLRHSQELTAESRVASYEFSQEFLEPPPKNSSLWKLLPQPFGGKFTVINDTGIDIYAVAVYGGTILARQKISKRERGTLKIKTLSPYYRVATYAYQEGMEKIRDNFYLMMGGGLLMATGVLAPVGVWALQQAIGPVRGVATVDGVSATVANEVRVREGRSIKALVKCDSERYTFRLRIAHSKEKKLVVKLNDNEHPQNIKWLKAPADYERIMELEVKAQ